MLITNMGHEEAADSGKRLGIAFLISIILITLTISLILNHFIKQE